MGDSLSPRCPHVGRSHLWLRFNAAGVASLSLTSALMDLQLLAEENFLEVELPSQRPRVFTAKLFFRKLVPTAPCLAGPGGPCACSFAKTGSGH